VAASRWSGGDRLFLGCGAILTSNVYWSSPSSDPRDTSIAQPSNNGARSESVVKGLKTSRFVVDIGVATALHLAVAPTCALAS
jgi:hypothetical protein